MPNKTTYALKTINIIGLNYKTADIATRDKLSIPKTQYAKFLSEIKQNFEDIKECCLVSTCNRTELIFISKTTDNNSIQNLTKWIIDWLTSLTEADPTLLLEALYIHQGTDAIKHLMQVASGLDSMVLGEPQILGQIKEAVSIAKSSNAIKSKLTLIFDHVFTCAKKIRSTTKIGNCPVSMAFSAMQIVNQHSNNQQILIVGAGVTGQLLLKHLVNNKNNNHDVYITNRTEKSAESIAAEFGISAIAWSDFRRDLNQFDVIICAAQADHYLISKKDLKTKDINLATPTLCIDMAMPRNIDPEVEKLISVTLINIDDIGNMLQDNALQRAKAIPEAEKIISSQINKFINEVKLSEYHIGIKAFREYTKHVGADIIENIISDLKQSISSDKGLDKDIDFEKILKEYNYLFTQKWLHQPTKKIQEWLQSNKSLNAEDLFDLFKETENISQ
jgi:glutamyl-tRNA reductase